MQESRNTDPVAKLLQIQQDFKSKLAGRLSDIESDWLLLRDEISPDFTEIHLKTHSLVGAAGTFGALVVSTVARKLENQLKLLLNKQLTLNDDVRQQLEALFLELRDISDKWQPSSIRFIPEIKDIKPEYKSGWQSTIYLVEDDVEVAYELTEFLNNSGYKVIYYRDVTEFEREYKSDDKASAIIMDMAFEEGIVAGAETIKKLSKRYECFPPVLFISVHDEIQARLAAAQAGSKKYFTKPIDKSKLLNSLDKLTFRKKEKAYRILLIDDEQEILDYYGTILQASGINVLSFTNSFEGYRAIAEFKPELILLDLYMPECSGFDLAKVIRQDDECSSIPLVFLSSESDVTTQLAAMDLGCDDFLLKPVDPEYFIQTINARLKRARNVNVLNEKIKDALRESEYSLIALDKHAIVSMTDISGKIIFCNQHFINISGYSEEELIGRNHRVLKSGKHPDSFYNDLWSTISKGKIWHGQICNKAKNGNEYWVEATIVPFTNEKGIPYKYVSVRTDITEIKQAEEDAQKSEKRLLDQQETLNSLNMITDYILLEEDAFFNIVTQRGSEILQVDKVSIWILDNDKQEILCKKTFEPHNINWSSGSTLKEEDYPAYFSKHKNNIRVASNDACTNTAIVEFPESYLSALGISAMLDVPIRGQGAIVGFICCERTSGKRHWRPDEVAFVTGLADLVTLNIESSDRKKIEQQLTKANKAKSEFLSNMSHELRTPMNAISGFAQLISRHSKGKEDNSTKEYANEIIKASDHLIKMINGILNLSKIEAGEVELSIENINCFDVIDEALLLMSSLMESHNVSSNNLVDKNIFIAVDNTKIKQIVLNLISNAAKYNKDNGSITVTNEIIKDIVRINFIDTGKGISEQWMKGMFKSFSRLGEENGDIEGTGIGLVITKDLTELMGGKIGVESEVNKGSTFWIEFPFVKTQ